MKSGRLGLSAIDKRDVWSRWKAGQTLHEIGRAYGKCHYTIRAVLLPRGWRSHSQSERTFRERWLPVHPFVRSPVVSIELRLRWAGRSRAMVADLPIAPTMQASKHGTQGCGRNAVCLP